MLVSRSFRSRRIKNLHSHRGRDAPAVSCTAFRSRRRDLVLGRVPDSDVEALILEIEIAADTYPDLVAYHPASAKLEKSVPLRVEQLATEALVVLRAGLDGAVVPVVEACAKATGPER